jgi:hypothetical protein
MFFTDAKVCNDWTCGGAEVVRCFIGEEDIIGLQVFVPDRMRILTVKVFETFHALLDNAGPRVKTTRLIPEHKEDQSISEEARFLRKAWSEMGAHGCVTRRTVSLTMWLIVYTSMGARYFGEHISEGDQSREKAAPCSGG